MKLSFIILILFFSVQFSTFSQVNDEVSVVCLGIGEKAEKSFWVRGEKAFDFLDYLFEANPAANRKGCNHRFKSVSIPGVDGTLSLKVQEGLHGRRKEGNCISSYFNSFENEKYKAARMSNMADHEQLGIIIYVKKKGRKHATSKSDREAMVQFIRNHCCP